MSNLLSKDKPVLFLGIAEFLESGNTPFPIGPINIYQLSQHKSHIIYPGMISSNRWIILVSMEFLNSSDLSKWQLRIADEKDIELATISMTVSTVVPQPKSESHKLNTIRNIEDYPIYSGIDYALIHFQCASTVPHPGLYEVCSIYDGIAQSIGSVHFHYNKVPSLTPDQIKAIESDPNSAKTVVVELGCKHCSKKLRAYVGLERSPKLEGSGAICQTDLPDEFTCHCGKTSYSLIYIKENMHAFLLKDFSRDISGLSYVRRYGHEQVTKIFQNYMKCLDTEKLEPPIQQFIERNPILLSRFHAIRLFYKPDIIGRFQADFAIFDSDKQLWFIEIEKPTIKLFKSDSHPTAALVHAYNQVVDWLDQYAKYPDAILDVLHLNRVDVLGVRGAVIAGRSNSVSPKCLQRHLLNPPYPNIEFMTLDDLGNSLIAISRKLA